MSVRVGLMHRQERRKVNRQVPARVTTEWIASMLTGTPLDLTPFGPLLSLLGVAYWLLALGLATLALWLPRRWPVKLATTSLLVALFAYPVLRPVGKPRLAEALTIFSERCKTAGEKIFRKVDNVEGVVWLKWREKTSNGDNYGDQWKLNDPYGNDCGAEDCIANLLRVTSGQSLNAQRAKRHQIGYRFVETTDPQDQVQYRYTAGMKLYWKQYDIDRHEKEVGGELPADSYQFAIERTPINDFTARYGVTWDDISTREDREHWIAGGSLKVIDLQTKELLAERIGYMIDRGQGSQAGFRSPWGLAVQTACPPFLPIGPSDSRPIRRLTESRDFVLRVLRQSGGE